MKLRKIRMKSKHIQKRFTKQTFSRKFSFRKNNLFPQKDSPYNTNEFLIRNPSSPFFLDDDEDSLVVQPSSIIRIEDDTNSELDIFANGNLESTNDESLVHNEKSVLRKEEMKRFSKDEKK